MEEKTSSITVSKMPDPTLETVEELAIAEDRDRSAQIVRLVKEAIAYRIAKGKPFPIPQEKLAAA